MQLEGAYGAHLLALMLLPCNPPPPSTPPQGGIVEMNLDRRFQKWLVSHQSEWQEGCWCVRCQAISNFDERALRGMFIRELIQSREVVETNQLQLPLA